MGELIGFPRVHVVGIGGAGMSGLAKLLAQAGHRVTGSDLKPGSAIAALRLLGVDAWVGHRPDRAVGWDLVVVSSAVPDRDPEVTAARDLGIPVWERPALLGKLTKTLPTIGFTGTHGKTTTTAMGVAALRALGRDPSFMVGGTMARLNTNSHLGERNLFLLEADEAFGTFLSLSLTALAITNVEADHFDYYGDLANLEASFARVAGGVDGPVVVCADDPGSARVGAGIGAVTYGTDPAADWVIRDVSHRGTSVSFFLHHGDSFIPVTVPRPGVHIARNAAGVLALLAELGYDPAAAAGGLATFAGVRRRFEVKALVGGATVIDDYAHHPTEVAATLSAARLGSSGRVLAVFQPHRYTRTAELADQFGPALAAADLVVVSDVYAAGEAPEPGITGRLVADAASAAGAEVRYVHSRGDLATAVAAEVVDGDTVVVLGAGDVTLVADELIDLLGSR